SVPMPFVDGLFSGLDLAAGRTPTVEVTTTTYGSRSTLAQAIIRCIGALAALAALALIAVPGGRRPREGATGVLRTALANARPVDAFVAVILLGWWVIGPAFFDDGWVMSGEKNFIDSGQFS